MLAANRAGAGLGACRVGRCGGGDDPVTEGVLLRDILIHRVLCFRVGDRLCNRRAKTVLAVVCLDRAVHVVIGCERAERDKLEGIADLCGTAAKLIGNLQRSVLDISEDGGPRNHGVVIEVEGLLVKIARAGVILARVDISVAGAERLDGSVPVEVDRRLAIHRLAGAIVVVRRGGHCVQLADLRRGGCAGGRRRAVCHSQRDLLVRDEQVGCAEPGTERHALEEDMRLCIAARGQRCAAERDGLICRIALVCLDQVVAGIEFDRCLVVDAGVTEGHIVPGCRDNQVRVCADALEDHAVNGGRTAERKYRIVCLIAETGDRVAGTVE